MKNHRLQQALKDGVKIPEDGDWGKVPSRICGEYGGATEEDLEGGFADSKEKKEN